MRVAKVLEQHYQKLNIPHELVDLGELPPAIFAPTSYAAKPADFLPWQQRVLDAAGLHVVTPEYNGSYPGVLKYFIDMLKFPESFDHKPVALVGVASGQFAALRPVEQLQAVFGYRNAYIYPDRVFVGHVRTKFDAAGVFDAELSDRLARQAAGFAAFAARVRG